MYYPLFTSLKKGYCMKKRLDFVTNSSSSSYICEISGATGSGFDASASECGFCVCENGHTFEEGYKLEMELDELKKHMLALYDNPDEDIVKQIEKADTESEVLEVVNANLPSHNDGYGWYDEYSDDYLPAFLCPICTFDKIARQDLESYKNKLLHKTDEQLMQEIFERFKSYQEFQSFIK